jgi:hypothetical protein
MLNNIAALMGSPSGAVAGDYEFIAAGTTGSNSITFSSIPATYSHLQIRASVRTGNFPYNTDVAVLMRVGVSSVDTAANYSQHYLYGTGSGTPSAGGGGGFNYMQVSDMPGGSTTANTFGGFIVDILDYSSTNKYKTVRTLGGFDTNTTLGIVWFASGNWRNEEAIDTISLAMVGFGNAATFGTYSRVDLYGIK